MLSASSSSSTTYHERRRCARRNPETSSGDGGLGEVSANRPSSLWALRGVLSWHGREGRRQAFPPHDNTRTRGDDLSVEHHLLASHRRYARCSAWRTLQ